MDNLLKISTLTPVENFKTYEGWIDGNTGTLMQSLQAGNANTQIRLAYSIANRKKYKYRPAALKWQTLKHRELTQCREKKMQDIVYM